MNKLAKDVRMLREAARTRGFWRDFHYVIWFSAIFAALIFKYRGEQELSLLLALTVVSFLLCTWYILSSGYILFTYGTVQRFKISEVGRIQFRYVQGVLHGEDRRYMLRTAWAVDLKAGDTILVVRHPYRKMIGWISIRSAHNYGQLERFQAMQIGSLPMYYEDMLQPK
jgi:hypothetical protein